MRRVCRRLLKSLPKSWKARRTHAKVFPCLPWNLPNVMLQESVQAEALEELILLMINGERDAELYNAAYIVTLHRPNRSTETIVAWLCCQPRDAAFCGTDLFGSAFSLIRSYPKLLMTIIRFWIAALAQSQPDIQHPEEPRFCGD